MKLTNLLLTGTAGTDMLTDLFDGFSSVATKVKTFFVGLFENVVGMIWVSGTGLTSFGKLLIIPIGIGAFWLVFKMIRKFIHF